MIKRIPWILLFLLSVVLLVSCSTRSTEPPAVGLVTPEATAAVRQPAPFPLTVESSDGRSVTLSRRPERIVSLSPGITEVLFALGAGGQVVGTDRFSDYPEAVRALPKVEYTNTNVEALVALRPDLVMATTRQRELLPVFEAAGLQVLFQEEPASVAAVYERIEMYGRMTERQAAAMQLAASLQARVLAVTERLAGVSSGPRVYHELSPRLFSASPVSFVGNLYTLLKAQNIAGDSRSAYPQLNAEAVIQADPEVIVLTAAEAPGGSVEEVKARPGWRSLSAVRQGRVYAVNPDIVSRPGPRIVDGLEALARLLYPDLFR